MKITNIVGNIARKIDITKYEREQNQINQFVRLHGDILEEPSLNEIFKARKAIANYVSENGLALDVYVPSDKNNKSLVLSLEDLFFDKSAKRTVDSDISKEHAHIQKGYFIVECPRDGLEIARRTEKVYEDNFIRHVFRQIVDMKNELRNNHR